MSQICVVSIYVPEMKKAVDFYRDVLGFEVAKEYGTSIISLKNGDLPLILEESHETNVKSGNEVSGVIIALSSSNINETLQHLMDHNVEILTDEPMDCPPGKFIRFKDPFGNVLEYLQFI